MLTVTFWIGKKEDCKDSCKTKKTFSYIYYYKILNTNVWEEIPVELSIEENKITLVIDRKNEKAVEDAWRKAVLIYRMKYNNDLNFNEDNKDNIEVMDDGLTTDDRVTTDDIIGWIGKTFLEQGFKSPLGSNWDDDFLHNIIAHNTKSDALKNPAFISMYNYLTSKAKKYDMDRFLYLWIAVNGYYNALTRLALGEIARDYFIDNRFFYDTPQYKTYKDKFNALNYNTDWDEEYEPRPIFRTGTKLAEDMHEPLDDYPCLSCLENVMFNENVENPRDKSLYFASQPNRNKFFDKSLTLDEKSYEAFSTQIRNLSRDIKRNCPGFGSTDVWEIVYDCSLEMMKNQFKMEWEFSKDEENGVNGLLSAFDGNSKLLLYLYYKPSIDKERKEEIAKIKDAAARNIITAYCENKKDNPNFNIAKKVNKLLHSLLEALKKTASEQKLQNPQYVMSFPEAYLLRFFFRNIAILKMDNSVIIKDFPLFLMFLCEYPYHWRNQLFHAKRTPALFAIPDDAEIETYDMLSCFLDRYLGENIPILVKAISNPPKDNDDSDQDDGDRKITEWTNAVLDAMMYMEAHGIKNEVDRNSFLEKDDDGKYLSENVARLIWGKK